LFLPINQPCFEVVDIEWKALTKQISAAIKVTGRCWRPMGLIAEIPGDLLT